MSLRLILDFGNTALKASLFEEKELLQQVAFKNDPVKSILKFIADKDISYGILASVINHSKSIESELSRQFPLLVFSSETTLPIKNKYATPDTLGHDRLAAAVAGWQLFSGSPVLAIMAGSCITYNIVNRNAEFLGGAIAPGLHMRLRAMHEFTEKLPFVPLEGAHPLTGQTTETSLRAGVHHASLAETEGMINRYKTEFPGLNVVIGGGDSTFLADGLKNGIFARPNLVTEGLNSILEYHVAKKLL